MGVGNNICKWGRYGGFVCGEIYRFASPGEVLIGTDVVNYSGTQFIWYSGSNIACHNDSGGPVWKFNEAFEPIAIGWHIMSVNGSEQCWGQGIAMALDPVLDAGYTIYYQP